MTTSTISDFTELEDISKEVKLERKLSILQVEEATNSSSNALNSNNNTTSLLNQKSEEISEIIFNENNLEDEDGTGVTTLDHRRNSSFEEINNSIFHKIPKHKKAFSNSKILNTISERSNIIERKTIEEQIAILTIRIKKLKEQEQNMGKVTGRIKNQIFKEESTKFKKEQNKEELQKARLERNELLIKQKAGIEKAKSDRKNKLQNASENLKEKNKNLFDIARTDKVIMNTLASQFDSHYKNINNYKCLKAKEKRMNTVAERLKLEKLKEEKNKLNYSTRVENEVKVNKRLTDKLQELEKLELNCLEKLKHTKIHNNAIINELKAKSRILLQNEFPYKREKTSSVTSVKLPPKTDVKNINKSRSITPNVNSSRSNRSKSTNETSILKY